MAIALDADFRSLKTVPPSETADRPLGKAGSGEDFANSLARARDPDAAGAPAENAAEAALPATALPFLPATAETPGLTDEDAADGTTGPLGADAAAALVKSEIVVDRTIIREGMDARAGDPQPMVQTGPAMPVQPVSEAAITPEVPGNTNQAAQKTIVAESAEPEPRAVSEAPDSPAAAAVPAANTPEVASEVVTVIAAAAISPPASGTAVRASGNAPASVPSPRAAAQADSARAPRAAPGPEADFPADAATADLAPAAFSSAVSAGSGAENSSQGGSSANMALPLTAAAPASPQAAGPAPVMQAAAPAMAVLTASPAQIVDIVSRSAEDGQSDRVVVQLDPPELGRVSIDFKFDAQGLQHVTITSETPEAMRQLRQMHSELVQSLERHGIGSENMSFQHQQQSQSQAAALHPFAKSALQADNAAAADTLALAASAPGARTLPGGRLDIRL